jgi:hypothetical protein
MGKLVLKYPLVLGLLVSPKDGGSAFCQNSIIPQTTRLHVPADNTLYSHCYGNLTYKKVLMDLRSSML